MRLRMIVLLMSTVVATDSFHICVLVICMNKEMLLNFFFQAEDGIRDLTVTGVQTCALPIYFGLDRSALHLQADQVVGDGDAPDFLPDPVGSLAPDGFLARQHVRLDLVVPDRSEERRVGKECRSRWSPYH